MQERAWGIGLISPTGMGVSFISNFSLLETSANQGPGVVAHICYPVILEDSAGRSLVSSKPGTHSETLSKDNIANRKQQQEVRHH